ncbi:hypothetical protein [Methylobacterium planeticum]|uniref:hypothetical protein n=1 Tax=Methylobacterium planeticum TaxID=2615211 RepID=UPI001FEE6DA2|nr:hypothetical protein [Methylobacterium planeticum]
MSNEPQAGPLGTADPEEAAYLALHAERETIERSLALAQVRQRFGANADEVERAHVEERELLLTLDRLMTRIRAAEYKRQPGARRW